MKWRRVNGKNLLKREKQQNKNSLPTTNIIHVASNEVRVVLSSSRNPSIRIRQFLNELELAIPNTKKINRGHMSIDELVIKAYEYGAKYIFYVMSRRGNPIGIKFIEIKEESYTWLPYAIKIFGVKLLVDMPIRIGIKNKSRNAIIITFNSCEIADLFSQIFNIPIVNTREVEKFKNMYDTLIIFRNVYNRDWNYEIHFIDGKDFGPKGPIIRIENLYYLVGKKGVSEGSYES